MATKKKTAKRPAKRPTKNKGKSISIDPGSITEPMNDVMIARLGLVHDKLDSINVKGDISIDKLNVEIDSLVALDEKLEEIHRRLDGLMNHMNADQGSWTDRAVMMSDGELFEANDAIVDEIERRGAKRTEPENLDDEASDGERRGE